MSNQELFDLIVETSSELEDARYKLNNTPAPRISYSDIEDVSDAYQERLEYNWWVDEQKGLIEQLEKELASYKNQLSLMEHMEFSDVYNDFESSIGE